MEQTNRRQLEGFASDHVMCRAPMTSVTGLRGASGISDDLAPVYNRLLDTPIIPQVPNN